MKGFIGEIPSCAVYIHSYHIRCVVRLILGPCSLFERNESLLHIMYTYVYRNRPSSPLQCHLAIPSSHMDSVEGPCAHTHVYVFVHTVVFAYDLMHMCMDNYIYVRMYVHLYIQPGH